VIPFLNEGIEVFRTVKSIRDTVGDSVNIILINDASDDGIDYKVVANEFNCKYVWNSKRLGVAGSRDMGVQLCETEMCLLLDSHMRFYDSDWLGVIVSEITSDPRRVYCTGCVPLWYPFDEKQSKETGLSTGAFLQTSFKDWHTSFEPKWLPLRLSGIEHIPLVLGATYCFTKDYYVELGGLSGLKSYGSDEAWISLKSWAIGNGCAVIGNVGIGHVFRDKTGSLNY
jgi:glycosyltransferase involved in cell wall biosynthesis